MAYKHAIPITQEITITAPHHHSGVSLYMFRIISL